MNDHSTIEFLAGAYAQHLDSTARVFRPSNILTLRGQAPRPEPDAARRLPARSCM
jgi:hypothetical protein